MLSDIVAFAAGFAEGFLVLGPTFSYLEEHYEEGFSFENALLIFNSGFVIGYCLKIMIIEKDNE